MRDVTSREVTQLRRTRHLSAQALATRLGVAEEEVQAWEAGERPVPQDVQPRLRELIEVSSWRRAGKSTSPPPRTPPPDLPTQAPASADDPLETTAYDVTDTSPRPAAPPAPTRRRTTKETTRTMATKKTPKKKTPSRTAPAGKKSAKKKAAKKKAAKRKRRKKSTAKKKTTTQAPAKSRRAKKTRRRTSSTAQTPATRGRRGPQAPGWVHTSPEAILAFREEHGLSEHAAAQALKVSVGSLRAWTKKGKVGSLAKQAKAAAAMASYTPASPTATSGARSRPARQRTPTSAPSGNHLGPALELLERAVATGDLAYAEAALVLLKSRR